jgi:LPXTG-site transpeptidase (sortase) family protein
MSRPDYLNNFGNYLRFVEARRYRWQVFISMTEFIVIIVLTAVIVNFPSYVLRARYFINPQGVAKVFTYKEESQIAAPQAEGVAQAEAPAPISAETLPRDTIAIGKIGLQAPVVWNIDSNKVQEALREGVAHIAGSSAPGTPGNTFMTGHSSDYWWTSGGYKAVFALLDKVANGDEIGVEYHGYQFKYKVYNKEIVGREDVNRFITTDKNETLTLMTCYPIGTNWKRLIVRAERIK